MLRQIGPDAVPWHVWSQDDLAVCPALAWVGPVPVAEGSSIGLSLDAVVLDLAPSHAALEAIGTAGPEAVAPWSSVPDGPPPGPSGTRPSATSRRRDGRC